MERHGVRSVLRTSEFAECIKRTSQPFAQPLCTESDEVGGSNLPVQSCRTRIPCTHGILVAAKKQTSRTADERNEFCIADVAKSFRFSVQGPERAAATSVACAGRQSFDIHLRHGRVPTSFTPALLRKENSRPCSAESDWSKYSSHFPGKASKQAFQGEHGVNVWFLFSANPSLCPLNHLVGCLFACGISWSIGGARCYSRSGSKVVRILSKIQRAAAARLACFDRWQGGHDLVSFPDRLDDRNEPAFLCLGGDPDAATTWSATHRPTQ
nr:hypothetical protein CFP56_08059 [Quercus suber]